MSPRVRFVLILVGTIAAVGAAVAYMGARAYTWHQRGYLGVFFLNGVQTKAQAMVFAVKDGEVMVTMCGTPADGRLQFRDEVLSINGIPRKDIARLRALDEQAKRGTPVVFRVRRGKQILDVPMRLASPFRARMIVTFHAAALLTGLTFAAIGLLVMLRSPGDQRAMVFYTLALISSFAIIGQTATIYEQAGARGILSAPESALPRILTFTAFAFLYPPLILHLSLIFPRRRPILERHPIILRWIYAAALVAICFLALASAIAVIGANETDPARATALKNAFLEPWDKVAVAISALYVIYILVRARREGIRSAIARRPFGVALASVGLLAGIADALNPYLPRAGRIVLGVLTSLTPMLVLLSFPFLAFAALLRSYRAANVEEKRQVAWPLWGLLIAVTGKIAGYILSAGFGAYLTLTHANLIRWRGLFETINLLPMLITLAIPISFAVAIFKYRLMNIDVIIRKTVVYAVLSGTIVILYLVLVGGLGSFLVLAFGLENQTTMIIGSTLVAALIFVPLRNKLQSVVDRSLFRHKYDYPEALKAISTDSRNAGDAQGLLQASAEKLQQALQNRAVVMFAERQEDYVAVAKVGVADSLLGRLRVPASFAESLDRAFDPRKRAIGEEASAALTKIETELVVPIGTRAFIAVAPKLSGGGYDVEDIDLLRSTADALRAGLDRIRMQGEEEDFAQARAIQQTLIPREMPRVAKLDVSGVWHPARTMGGDYYDLIELGETELAVCIGDVAGKGMPAALTMSGLQAAVRASASSSPRDLCERVRRVVVSSLTGGRFVTFFYATIDTAAMRLRWCNAGHNAPVLARADGTIVRLAEGGPAFTRLFRHAQYEESELPLLPGDRIVLFTDGVSEAGDPLGELFGEVRIEELVTDSRDLTAVELQETIVEAASSFSGGELEDDLTLVVARITE